MAHYRPPVRPLPSISLVLVLTAMACSDAPPSDPAAHAGSPVESAGPVGRAVCAACHAEEAQSWEGSHHDLAMQPADETTILGDFDEATFTEGEVTSRFFREGGAFMVATDGPDGDLHDYRVTHTFGVDPLQQYLVEMPGGRLQALSICWDTRPRDQGGQRWFHLYPGEGVDFRDPLHWTGPLHNWNSSCAECHSTNLEKNYRLDEDRYETTWSEIDVSCEACHGPGSRHVAWVGADTESELTPGDSGFDVSLARGAGARWIFDPGNATARRAPARGTHAEIEACGRCHARSERVAVDYTHGRPLADTHRVSLLDQGLYHADGQILDEVYVYGSFLQSAMYRGGVTCSDCHDPHSARLRAAGNAVCGPCHKPTVFDSPDHHFHAAGSPGASCVGCHMPSRIYMVVDPRHDHGFRVPRPDLTVEIGIPNACTACHGDRDAAWAARTVKAWHPNGRSGRPHHAEAIQAGRTWRANAGPRLASLIADTRAPAIVRATALSLLGRYPGTVNRAILESTLRDPDALVRRAAVGLLGGLGPVPRSQLGAALLSDPIRTVRLDAVRALAEAPAGPGDESWRASLDDGLEEYRASQRFHADRAEGQMNLAWLHSIEGREDEAERAYRTALVMTPSFSPAAINLADLYRSRGRDDQADRVLRLALSKSPEDANLHHALGLLLARQKRYDAAIGELQRAVDLSHDAPHHAFALGIALDSAGRPGEALLALENAHAEYPSDVALLLALTTINRDQGNFAPALRWIERLLEVDPGNAAARELRRSLSISDAGPHDSR